MGKGNKDTERLSRKKKDSNKKQWYKDKAKKVASGFMSGSVLGNYSGGIKTYRDNLINYKLYNNKIDSKDFEYICKPLGNDVGELPARMTNKDIISPKIKAIEGMEMKRPFPFKVFAVNPDATTAREKKEFDLIKKSVVDQLLMPVRQEMEIKKQEALANKELPEEDKKQIIAQIEQEYEGKSPEEIKHYMKREYQDPVEVAAQRLVNFLVRKTDFQRKINQGFKHLSIGAGEVYYIGEENGHPTLWNVNLLDVDVVLSEQSPFIEDAEEICVNYNLSFSQVIDMFSDGDDALTNNEIDKLSQNYAKDYNAQLESTLFTFSDHTDNFGANSNINTIPVKHCCWRGLRKVGFLDYKDVETGEVLTTTVDENYKINTEAGDVSIRYRYITEAYEAWILGTDIYKRMRPIPGQRKTLDNLTRTKFNYFGAFCDNMNGEPTSLIDRGKLYQYYYNIVMYRIEMLMATDKGKKVLMNIGALAKSNNMDLKKWQYFFETTPFGWVDPSEEGTNYNDVNSVAKVIDLSLASDIDKYINLAEFIRQQLGRAIGIPDNVEGQMSQYQAVSNTQQSLIQTSHILEPYFNLHDLVKRNILQGLLDKAKVVYHGRAKEKLQYILDDLSVEVIDLEIFLKDSYEFGIFISNNTKDHAIKQQIEQLSHAALQNQKINLSDVVKILKEDNIAVSEEILQVAEDKLAEREQAAEEGRNKALSEENEKMRQFKREEHKMDIEKIKIKEEERRKTELEKAAVMGMSFNPEQDLDKDGVNDFLEIARHGLDADIKHKQIDLERQKLRQEGQAHQDKIEVEKMKIKQSNNK